MAEAPQHAAPRGVPTPHRVTPCAPSLGSRGLRWIPHEHWDREAGSLAGSLDPCVSEIALDHVSGSSAGSERLCGCGCGASLAHMAVQVRYLNEAHRVGCSERARDAPRPSPEWGRTAWIGGREPAWLKGRSPQRVESGAVPQPTGRPSPTARISAPSASTSSLSAAPTAGTARYAPTTPTRRGSRWRCYAGRRTGRA